MYVGVYIYIYTCVSKYIQRFVCTYILHIDIRISACVETQFTLEPGEVLRCVRKVEKERGACAGHEAFCYPEPYNWVSASQASKSV